MSDLKEMFNDKYAKLYVTYNAADVFSTYLVFNKYGEEAEKVNPIAAEIFKTYGNEVGSLIYFVFFLSPVPLIYYYNKKIVNSRFSRIVSRVCYMTLISIKYIATFNNLLFYMTNKSIMELYSQIEDPSLILFILLGFASYFIPKLFKNLFKTK